jgi:hypothetical protein
MRRTAGRILFSLAVAAIGFIAGRTWSAPAAPDPYDDTQLPADVRTTRIMFGRSPLLMDQLIHDLEAEFHQTLHVDWDALEKQHIVRRSFVYVNPSERTLPEVLRAIRRMPVSDPVELQPDRIFRNLEQPPGDDRIWLDLIARGGSLHVSTIDDSLCTTRVYDLSSIVDRTLRELASARGPMMGWNADGIHDSVLYPGASRADATNWVLAFIRPSARIRGGDYIVEDVQQLGDQAIIRTTRSRHRQVCDVLQRLMQTPLEPSEVQK